MNKYNAKPVIVTDDGTLFEEALVKQYKLDIKGTRFASKKEGEYYQELLPLLKDGTLSEVICQPKYILQDAPKITYIADFLLKFSDGSEIVVDVKGIELSTFKLKLKLFNKLYPEKTIRILTKHRGEWIETSELRKRKSEAKKLEKQLLKRAATQKGRR